MFCFRISLETKNHHNGVETRLESILEPLKNSFFFMLSNGNTPESHTKHNMSTKRHAVDLTGSQCPDPKRAHSEVGSRAMFMYINDSSEPTEVAHYMFLVPDKKDMDSYVHDRLVELKSKNKWHFPYVKHDSFEGLVGPEFICKDKMEKSKGQDSDEEDDEYDESTMMQAFQSFFKAHMKPMYKWPRRGYGKVELANMDFIVDYTDL